MEIALFIKHPPYLGSIIIPQLCYGVKSFLYIILDPSEQFYTVKQQVDQVTVEDAVVVIKLCGTSIRIIIFLKKTLVSINEKQIEKQRWLATP